MATVIDGRATAAKVRVEVAEAVAAFATAHGRPPGLATVLVGDDPASAIYVRSKHQACEETGIASFQHELPAEASEDALLALVAKLAADDAVDGILVQLPLPEHVDELRVLEAIPAAKDVDGFHPWNIGALALGRPAARSCTPHGVMRLLDEYGIELRGAHAVVVGRSNIVGKPMALMLLERDATVTVAHRHTRALASVTREADVLVVATGVPRLITADMVKRGAVVIDVGTTRTQDGLVGDVIYDEVERVAGWITPVPGGVGPMTIATLLANTVQIAQARAAADATPAS